MKKVIYKYPLQIEDNQVFEVPKGAIILCVQIQREEPVLYALVDPSAETEEREFQVTGTGHELIDDVSRVYLGTIQLRGGDLVFHVFEITD